MFTCVADFKKRVAWLSVVVLLENYMAWFDSILWKPLPFLESIPVVGWLGLTAILLLFTGIWFTFALDFVQIREFKIGWNALFGAIFSKEKSNEGSMTSFQALATAVAAQVGTGNIVGASTAIAAGGPGAILWMWIAAFFGMSTIYAEAVLAQRYRHVDEDGTVTGGPVRYILAAYQGTLGKFLAGLFAILIILSLGFTGCAVQSNGISESWNVAFNIPKWVMGLIVAAASLSIFIGGMNRIAKITEKLVPFMGVFFILGAVYVILANVSAVPAIFRRIFVGAFNPQAVYGGVIGIMIKDAVSKGIARGLFSNEAGMGSTPHAHAVAQVAHPTEQGRVAMIGVFFVTFVIVTLTSLVVIGSGLFDPSMTGGTQLTGAALAQAAFSTKMGTAFGNAFIAIALLFFAFSTIIGWYFFGEANVRYLFGKKAVRLYALIVTVCVFAGSLAQVTWIWDMQDAFNGLMIIPNILGILALSKAAKEIMLDGRRKRAEEAESKK